MNSKHQKTMIKSIRDKKRGFRDWMFYLFTILSPIASLLCALLISNENYSESERLSTIVSGIAIPIVLIGLRQVEAKDLLIDTHKAIDKLENSISFTKDLAEIFSSGEEKRISFAKRRLMELNRVLDTAAHQHETELLAVSDYYSELNNIADLIEKDGDTKKCEIWAMTGFSDEEWHDEENDLESKWGRRIKKLSENFKTNRICIVEEKLAQLLKLSDKEFYVRQKSAWENHSSNSAVIQEKGLKSFFEYLMAYYQQNTIANYKLNSCVIRDSNQTYAKLIREHGFFGIKLSDENKFVIKGEAVNPATGLQGKYVFSDKDIKKLYDLHNRACRDEDKDVKTLQVFIQSETSSEFKEFLHENGINL